MTSRARRVLVTAVGGDLGQAVLKALRLSEMQMELYGCDADARGVGEAFVTSYAVVPMASDTDRYLEVLERVCRDGSIDVIVPASEAEIGVLSQVGTPPRLASGAKIVCQDASWIERYGDKLHCMRALEGRVALAAFADGGDQQAVDRLVAEVGFPVVVKSRRSSGSRTFRLAHTRGELDQHLAAIPSPMVQAHLEAEGGEFSAGIFACEGFEASIVFQRELGPAGCSWFAENSEDPDVTGYVGTIARLTGLRGSANVQVVKTAQGVRLLEINPRFSSLAATRAICGFRDVEWSIRLALGETPPPPVGPFQHVRFRRFFQELVDVGDGFRSVAQWAPR